LTLENPREESEFSISEEEYNNLKSTEKSREESEFSISDEESHNLKSIENPKLTDEQSNNPKSQILNLKWTRPWIVAMTANAMRGDREECMAAGMDDYLSKPIAIEELVRALSACKSRSNGEFDLPQPIFCFNSQPEQIGGTVLEVRSNGAVAGNQQLTIPHSPTVVACRESNLDRALLDSPDCLSAKIIEGLRDVEALDEAIDLYLETAPELLQGISVALCNADQLALRRDAHSLKSISGTLGAFRLFELCEQLEIMGRIGTNANKPLSGQGCGLFKQVEAEYQRVEMALRIERQSVD
jgi:CheY-like chemotaxis protein